MPKKAYYKKSQKEILDKFLNENCAFKIYHDELWQFKYEVINEDLIGDKGDQYDQLIKNDRDNGHIPTALMLARLEISKYSKEVSRFIAYNMPSG